MFKYSLPRIRLRLAGLTFTSELEFLWVSSPVHPPLAPERAIFHEARPIIVTVIGALNPAHFDCFERPIAASFKWVLLSPLYADHLRSGTFWPNQFLPLIFLTYAGGVRCGTQSPLRSISDETYSQHLITEGMGLCHRLT